MIESASEQEKAALRAALREQPQLRERLAAASSAEEFERIAAEAGLKVSAEGFLPGSNDELTDAELETVGGGYTFPTTDWIYCDNPWTNVYCTAKC